MKEHFINGFNYDHFTQVKLLEYVIKLQEDNKIEDFKTFTSHLIHITRAKRIWLERLTNQENLSSISFEFNSINELIEEENNVHQLYITYLSNLNEEDLSTLISYKRLSLDEKVYQNTITEIFTHLLFHGVHHRAQVNLLLRQNNIAPPPIDYIFYLRSQT
jgi:uncharacterized damage-inducible protein DinB